MREGKKEGGIRVRETCIFVSFCCRYAFVQFGSYFAAKNALEAVNMTKIKGRPVAVDWVVPKDQYEQSVRQEEGEEEKGGTGEDGEKKDEEALEIEAENEELDSESDSESHDSDAESHDSDSESHDSADVGTKEESDALKKDDVKEGKTLFIR